MADDKHAVSDTGTVEQPVYGYCAECRKTLILVATEHGVRYGLDPAGTQRTVVDTLGGSVTTPHWRWCPLLH